MMPTHAWDSAGLAADYHREGVARVKQLFSAGEVAAIRQRLIEYVREREDALPPGDITYEPDGKTIRNLWRLEQYDPFFDELSTQPRILNVIKDLVRGEVVRVGVETFNKPARVGTVVPYHQDNAYFCQAPPDMLSLWVAIDPATRENGAVIYLPRSHGQLQEHKPSGIKGNSFGLADPPRVDAGQEWQGTLEAGDALVHHCQVAHRSEPNRSDRSRLALVMVYRGSHTQTDAKLKEAYEKARAVVA